MLKLDNVPDTLLSTVDKTNDLGGAPNAADASTRSEARPGERSRYFVIWPSHVGERFVQVRISTEELSRVSGELFAIDSDKITAALVKHRPLIEERANVRLKDRPDASEVTLDLGDLR